MWIQRQFSIDRRSLGLSLHDDTMRLERQHCRKTNKAARRMKYHSLLEIAKLFTMEIK